MNHFKKILAGSVGHQLQCVEAHYISDDTLVFQLVVVQYFSRKLTILNHALDLDLTSLLKKLSSRYPVCIVVTGKGLLRKLTDNGEVESTLSTFVQGGNADNFMWNSFENELWIARKELVQQLLVPFHENRCSVVGLIIGTGLLSCVAAILPEGSIAASRYAITNTKYSITVEQLSNQGCNNVQLPHYVLPADGILAFAAGYCYFADIPAQQFTNLHALVTTARTNWYYHRKIRRTGITALLALFVLLVCNYLLFGYLTKRDNELEWQNRGNLALMEKYDSLNMQYQQRKAFLDKSGLHLHVDFAWMTDQIAMMVPEQLHLSAVVLFPVIIDETTQKDWSIYNGSIIVEGLSEHPAWVNEFVQKLKTLKWIKDVEVLYFKNEKQDEPGTFKIQITAK